MIQLATDPAASRAGFRSKPPKDAGSALGSSRSRQGHAWPFISRPVAPPAPRENAQTTRSDS